MHETQRRLTQSVDDHGVVDAVFAAADVGGGDGDRTGHADHVGQSPTVWHPDADAALVA